MWGNVIYEGKDIYAAEGPSMRKAINDKNDIYARDVIYAGGRPSVRRRTNPAGSPAACRRPALTRVGSTA